MMRLVFASVLFCVACATPIEIPGTPDESNSVSSQDAGHRSDSETSAGDLSQDASGAIDASSADSGDGSTDSSTDAMVDGLTDGSSDGVTDHGTDTLLDALDDDLPSGQ